jgi:hypothetical protein
MRLFWLRPAALLGALALALAGCASLAQPEPETAGPGYQLGASSLGFDAYFGDRGHWH